VSSKIICINAEEAKKYGIIDEIVTKSKTPVAKSNNQ